MLSTPLRAAAAAQQQHTAAQPPPSSTSAGGQAAQGVGREEPLAAAQAVRHATAPQQRACRIGAPCAAWRGRYDYDKGTFATNDELGELRYPMAELLAASPVRVSERKLDKCTSGTITFELSFTPDKK